METVIERLGRYAIELESSQIPQPSRDWVKRALIDGLACAFMGINSPPARSVRTVTSQMGGSRDVTLWGLGERTSLYWAALANGVALRYWDMNDVYFGPAWTAHPSDNVAAVLGTAEYVKASGAEFLDALVTAYEVQLAFSDLPVERNLWHRGWHHTVACGYASAAATSRLLGLDVQAAGHALALAGARGNTLSEIRHGAISMDKALSAPFIAANGVLCALLAREGFTGCTTLLEGPYGFQEVVAGGTDVSALVPSPDAFRSTKISLKPYPVEGMTITMVEAALEAASRYGGEPGTIDEITVTTYEEALTKPSWDEVKVYPDSKETADHSFSFCVALAIVAGRVTLAEFSPDWLANQTVRELIPKVVLRSDEHFTALYRQGSRPAAVEIRGRAGSSSAEVLYPKGDPKNPMTDGELAAKFRFGADPILGSQAGQLFQRLLAIDDEPDVSDLTSILGTAMTTAI